MWLGGMRSFRIILNIIVYKYHMLKVIIVPVTDVVVTDYLVLLSNAERERTLRFKTLLGQQEHLCSYLLQRHVILSECPQLRNADLVFDRTDARGKQQGKPYCLNAPKVHYSVSHSHGCVVVAYSSSAECGIDAEVIRPNIRQILSKQFGSDNGFNNLNERQATKFWTRLEAYLKYIGLGLSGLDRIVCTTVSENHISESDGNCCVHFEDKTEQCESFGSLIFTDISDHLSDDHVGCVVSNEELDSIRTQTLQELKS